MSFEEVVGAVQRLGVAADALGVIGAELTLRTSGADADPELLAALRVVTEAAGVPDLGELAPPQLAILLSLVRMNFAHATEVLNDPARPPGWSFTDSDLLDGYGRGSTMVPTFLATAPELQNVTSLLDVGTGVGLLAIAATNVWPSATVVGIDTWDTSLERAHTNVKEAGLDDRITLRNQNISAVDDVDAFDCVWVPTFFIEEDDLVNALPKLLKALRPEGWIVFGRFNPPPDPLAKATGELRTARSGGCTIDLARATALLEQAGCASVHEIELATPVPLSFVIGQKPSR